MRKSFLVALSLLVGCEQDETKAPSADGEPQAKVESSAKSVPSELDDAALRELLRDPSPEATERLQRLLHGGANERRMAPLGLGLRCTRDNSEHLISSLIGAAAAWAAEPKGTDPENYRTLGFAIGACGTDEAEQVLRHWLTPSGQSLPPGLSEAAVFGLGAYADRRGSLDERTQTAVLDAASRSSRPDFLMPLGRVARLSEAVGAHILEVAGKLLTVEKKGSRRHAIFALGSAGPSAAAPLGQVLLAESYSPDERAAAAQALGRLGGAGQKTLDETLEALLSQGLPTEFDRLAWIPLRATLEALEEAQASKKLLGQVGTAPLPDGKERKMLAQRRRLVWLRCQAARLLARGRAESPLLLACDPDKGREFHLAQLKVLDSERIEKSLLRLLEEKTKSEDPSVAQAALRLLASHPEVEESGRLLLLGLKAEQPGTRAAAAQVIFAYPARAHGKGEKDDTSEKIVSELGKLLSAPANSLPSETRAALIKAGGAMSALSLKPVIEKYCKDENQAYWAPASQALKLLGDSKTACPEKPPQRSIQAPPFEPVTFVIESDVGPLELSLEARDAPVSAHHFKRLVDSGTYSNMAVHAARPGFAVQFGDADGDGYQDALSPPLPHEVSPEPFSQLTFGMSAFSPGSHDRQIFVVTSDAPQLFAERVWLGHAKGAWHLLAPGDLLYSIRKKP